MAPLFDIDNIYWIWIIKSRTFFRVVFCQEQERSVGDFGKGLGPIKERSRSRSKGSSGTTGSNFLSALDDGPKRRPSAPKKRSRDSPEEKLERQNWIDSGS